MTAARCDLSARAVRHARFACALLPFLLVSCAKRPEPAPPETLVWVPGGARTPLRSGVGDAALAPARDGIWIAYTETHRDAASVHVRFAPDVRTRGARTTAEPALVARFAGRTPSIGVGADGEPLVAFAVPGPPGEMSIAIRRGQSDGQTWSEPEILMRGRDLVLAPNRLVRTRTGEWLLPLVADSVPTCLRSPDGRTWSSEPLRGWPSSGRAPAILEAADGKWHGFASIGRVLARTTSSDAGRSWTAFDSVAVLPLLQAEIAFAAAATDAGALLAWTEALTDSSVQPPGVWTLRLARASWHGNTLERLPPLARRAALVLDSPALAAAPRAGVAAWFTAHDIANTGSATAACLRLDMDALAAARDDVRRQARAGLDLWAQHVLARPAAAQRLFIEAYTMRGLVAAYETLSPRAAAGELLAGADTERGVLQARSFADWLLSGQDASGHWPLGYRALYLADMAVVVGLYAALVPHVDAQLQQRFTESARRFAAGMQADGLLLPDGGVGVGWVETRVRHEANALRRPYLVSTALAGIETHAWLYARTHDPAYARRARASLEYTLAAIRPDGSLPAFESGELHEGSHVAAAYVQEGWMAADRLLDDPQVHAQLARALPAHVSWLVQTQNSDGTWGDAAKGESARAIAVVNFLIWYDRRCESRADVREALRRAAAPLVDPDRWLANGLLRRGKHEDVQRALAGRTLAALAAGEPVF